MRKIILLRSADASDAEALAARRHFPLTENRTAIWPDDLVIARYSALPFYRELEADLAHIGAKLINSYHQHMYVADMRNWAEDLREVTPQTWYRLEDIPSSEVGPFVVKGQTNSRKADWNTLMYAADRAAAADVVWRLSKDLHPQVHSSPNPVGWVERTSDY